MQKKNFIGFRDRILLHLLRFEKEVYDNIHGDEVDGSYKEFLINLTQEGIAANVGTKQSTIYKELQMLRTPALAGEEPLIKIIDKVRIPGKERACSVYFLSNYGHDLAEQKKNYIEDKNLEVSGLENTTDNIISIKELSKRLISESFESNDINAILRVASAVTFDGKIKWSELIEPENEPQKPEKAKIVQTETLEQKDLKDISKVENPYFNRIAIKDPKYFYGRTSEVQYIASLLRNCQSCSIIGPRRSGKSSLINYISHHDVLTKLGLNVDEFIFVPIDLEGLAELSQSEFFSMIIEEIRNRVSNNDLRKKIENILSNEQIRFLDVKSIMKDINDLDKKVIFLFDEFELITNNRNLDCNFYSGLRNLANSFNVAYITSSHVPLLDLTLSQDTLGSPFFNFFTQLELGLMDPPAVNRLITEPSANNGVVFPDNIIRFINTTAGPHAFFIQILCYHIFNVINEKGTISDQDLVELKDLFFVEAKPHFQYFWNHLSDDERTVLLTLSNVLDTSISSSNIDQNIIQSLLKKALLTVESENYKMFSAGFTDFVTSQDQTGDLTRKEPETPIIQELQEQKQRDEVFIEWGGNYYIDEYSPEVSLSIYRKMIDQGATGLFITRTEPERANELWSLGSSDIIWLCSRSGPGCLPPALEKISHTIIEFINKNPISVIFLDGLEFIVNNNDFLRTLSLLDNLKENIAIKKSVLIFPISSSIFSEKEMALFGKNSININNDVQLNYLKLGSE